MNMLVWEKNSEKITCGQIKNNQSDAPPSRSSGQKLCSGSIIVGVTLQTIQKFILFNN